MQLNTGILHEDVILLAAFSGIKQEGIYLNAH